MKSKVVKLLVLMSVIISTFLIATPAHADTISSSSMLSLCQFSPSHKLDDWGGMYVSGGVYNNKCTVFMNIRYTARASEINGTVTSYQSPTTGKTSVEYSTPVLLSDKPVTATFTVRFTDNGKTTTSAPIEYKFDGPVSGTTNKTAIGMSNLIKNCGITYSHGFVGIMKATTALSATNPNCKVNTYMQYKVSQSTTYSTKSAGPAQAIYDQTLISVQSGSNIIYYHQIIYSSPTLSSSFRFTETDTTPDLFQNGVNFNDVQQGSTGDCWLLALIQGVALRDPSFIESIIKETSPYHYVVKLFDKNGVPKYIDVSLEEILKEQPQGAFWDKEFWVNVLEMAFAKYYYAIDNGITNTTTFNWSSTKNLLQYIDASNYPFTHTDAYSALTNKGSYRYIFTMSSYEELEAFNTQGEIITVAIPKQENLEGLISLPSWYNSGHEYTVVDIKDKIVTLRNPWGAGDGTNQGLFKISFDDFYKYFNHNIFIGSMT